MKIISCVAMVKYRSIYMSKRLNKKGNMTFAMVSRSKNQAIKVKHEIDRKSEKEKLYVCNKTKTVYD